MNMAEIEHLFNVGCRFVWISNRPIFDVLAYVYLFVYGGPHGNQKSFLGIGGGRMVSYCGCEDEGGGGRYWFCCIGGDTYEVWGGWLLNDMGDAPDASFLGIGGTHSMTSYSSLLSPYFSCCCFKCSICACENDPGTGAGCENENDDDWDGGW